jgi:hypothetical protein
VGHAGTVREFLQLGFNLSEQIDTLRAKSGDERAQLKKSLPAATISGLFSTRCKQGLLEHSGLIAVDIDHVADCGAIIRQLSQIDIVAYASRSVSGQGVFAIIPIAYPHKHLAQWKALRAFFHEQGITLDAACSDVSRMRICSYDTEAIIRTDAVPFEGVFVEPPPRVYDYVSSSDETEAKVAKCCEELVKYRIDLTQSYEQWLKIGFSLADGLGESGRRYFHMVSSVNPTYSYHVCNAKYSECLRSVRGCGIGYFFNRCKDFGVITTSRKF